MKNLEKLYEKIKGSNLKIKFFFVHFFANLLFLKF